MQPYFTIKGVPPLLYNVKKKALLVFRLTSVFSLLVESCSEISAVPCDWVIPL